MAKQTDTVFKVVLTTKGRKTGNSHSVMLRAVKYNDKFYFSRHRPDGDWFQNAIADPDVTIKVNGLEIKGKASQVSDENLEKKISELKYPGEKRAKDRRVAIEVTPHEQ